MLPLKYVLITAIRNEAATIGVTLECMAAQTLLPAEWIIVSDGSTDATDSLVAAAAQGRDWIKLVQLPPRAGRSFAAMVAAINAGRSRLQCQDCELIGLLDGDLQFQPDYFDRVVAALQQNSRLGLAGGMVVDVGHRRDQVPRNKVDVPGAVQLFRRDCYEALNGYFVIPEGGFDAVACAHARMLGYETKLLTDLIVDHLKPRNISAGGVLRRHWQLGLRDYAMGSHPLFELLKCSGRVREFPAILGAVARWLGYSSRAVRRSARVMPHALVSHIHREQLARLKW
jgi:glycosyltransferase involved in cell wall biosynthesis